MTTLLDLLEDAAGGTGTVRHPAAGGDAVPFADIWRESARVAAFLRPRCAGGSVAIMLAARPGCLAVLIGAWRAGLTVASVPHPGRGTTAQEYQEQLAGMCALVDARLLLMPDDYLAVVPEMPFEVRGFGACTAPGPAFEGGGPGELVQFSSGSTGRPKGVRLSSEKIATNILSIIEVLEPRPGDAVCSWLPLSHDMGLIGLCLASLVEMGPRRSGGIELTLLPPEGFLRRPSSWLDAVAERRAAITGVPNFAFDLAARWLPRSAPGDLSSVRVCLTGGEVVRGPSLRAFAQAAAPYGFASQALAPAYGLAEVTLAVAIVGPRAHWRSWDVDPQDLAEYGWTEVPVGTGTEVVGNGPPVPGVEVRIAGGAQVGEIEVASPSLLDDYVGADLDLVDGRWLPTRDVGALVDGEVLVCGRLDDVLVIRGRNLYAWDLETVAAGHPAVRRGNCVAVQADSGYAVVAERASAAAAGDLAEATAWIRRQLSASCGIGPTSVSFVVPGSLPKTPSGKIQRRRIAAALAAGGLSVEAEQRFGGGA